MKFVFFVCFNIKYSVLFICFLFFNISPSDYLNKLNELNAVIEIFMKEKKVRNFLNLIARCEGTLNKDRYKKLGRKYKPSINEYKVRFGGGSLSNFSDHHKIIFDGDILGANKLRVRIASTAVGRYQFIKKTWNDISQKIFMPKSLFNDDFVSEKIEKIYKNIGKYYVGVRYFYTKKEDLYGKDFGPFLQDLGAIWLIYKKDAINEILNGEYDLVINKLCRVWATFPNGKSDQSYYPNQPPAVPYYYLKLLIKKMVDENKKKFSVVGKIKDIFKFGDNGK
jgi:muramidase (phage lysozyme)